MDVSSSLLQAREHEYASCVSEKVLSAAFSGEDQLQQYYHDGFAIFPEFLSEAHLSELREAFDERIRHKQEVELGCNWADSSTAPFLRVLQDERLLDLLSKTCGEPFVAMRLELFEKDPRSLTAIPWHQDTFTTHIGWDWAANSTGFHPLTLWVALDDVNLTNGGMEMVPGRHHENLGGIVTDDMTKEDRRIEYQMVAGQAGIHHPLTPHRSCANETDGKRRAFLVRFSPWTAKIEAQCGPTTCLSSKAAALDEELLWFSAPSGRYVWLPGNDASLSQGYRLNRLFVCLKRS
jgi:hypothetical protein